MDGATIQLLDGETGRPVGRITRAQLQWLVDQLEEESEDDRDYYIDGPTLDICRRRRRSALILTLRTALEPRGMGAAGLERWTGSVRPVYPRRRGASGASARACARSLV